MSKEQELLEFVKKNATQGDADSVLKAIDTFGWNHQWSKQILHQNTLTLVYSKLDLIFT